MIGTKINRELQALHASIEYRVEEETTYVRVYRRDRRTDEWEKVMSVTRDEWEILIGTKRPSIRP